MTDTIFKPGEYVTRDGRKARVYATDGASQPIHGAVFEGRGWFAYTWRADGCYCDAPTASDLMPPKQVGYWNVYKDHQWAATRAEADSYAAPNRIACFRIEFTEGQYDD